MLSEVGSKDAEAIFAPYQWVQWIREELAAGAWKVITEARESGTAGIFRGSGEVRSGLIDEIVHELPVERPALRGAAEGAAGVVHPAVRVPTSTSATSRRTRSSRSKRSASGCGPTR